MDNESYRRPLRYHALDAPKRCAAPVGALRWAEAGKQQEGRGLLLTEGGGGPHLPGAAGGAPDGSEADIQSIDNDPKYFVTNYYNTIYRGSAKWLPLCLSTISSLMDIIPLIRACGPAWVLRQFPMKRKIGTLAKQIRSSSRPHATLVKNVTRKCKADLITSFGQQYLPTEWAETTKKSWTAHDLPRGSLKVPQDVGPDCALLPPRSAPVGLEGAELASMRAVLIQENADKVPLLFLAEKYYRAKLASYNNTGSKPVGRTATSAGAVTNWYGLTPEKISSSLTARWGNAQSQRLGPFKTTRPCSLIPKHWPSPT